MYQRKYFLPLLMHTVKKDEPSFILHKLPIFGDSKLRFPFQNNTCCFLFLENGDGVKVPLQKAKISDAKHVQKAFVAFFFQKVSK